MSAFDELKNVVNDLRKDYSDFTKLDSSDFPSEKTGNRKIFTMGEAAILFEEQLQMIESALEDEARCVRYIPGDDMPPVRILLASTKQYIDGKDYHNFTTNIENIIPHISSFAILSMEKMDSKRYSEIKELETVLREIKEHGASITNIKNTVVEKSKQIENTYNDVSSKLETLGENIDGNQQKSDSLSQLQGDSEQRLEQIQSMHDDINKMKDLFDSFIGMIDERNKDIDNQKAKTKIYDEKLEGYEKEHKETIKEYNTERKESLEKARELIASAERATEVKSSEGLSMSFLEKERKMANKKAKRGWISLTLVASIGAIFLGWYTSHTAEEGLKLVTVTRTFLMLIAMGVAGFAARQYSKNKSIELDYGYKSALAGSYPGLAKAFQEADKELRAKYAIRFMEEVLQDPQRNRNKKDSTSRFSTETVETEKESQKQAEPPVPPNNE